MRDLCFSMCISLCVRQCVYPLQSWLEIKELWKRGNGDLPPLPWGNWPFCSHALFIFSLNFTLSLSPLCLPPFTHTYRSPWRWKVEGGARVLRYENADKTLLMPSHLLIFIISSLPLLLYFLIASLLCLHNFHLPGRHIRHHHLVSFRSSLLCHVSSSRSQIVEIKIVAVRQLMKST